EGAVPGSDILVGRLVEHETRALESGDRAADRERRIFCGLPRQGGEDAVDLPLEALETLVGRRAGLVPQDLAEHVARLVEESLLSLRLCRLLGLRHELERALELRGCELLQLGTDRALRAERLGERLREQALGTCEPARCGVLAAAGGTHVDGAGVAVVAVGVRLTTRRERAG